ncbi:DUF2235 domain-containing protein [Methylocystis sp. H4A]|uniref:DUF2235 domain-containing protein n=1 Tax=Methylocystis sp. H4A TaxID=2785788 RepID=UPI0018C2CF57|nr:DUF2235 domain-containing protein [Methylocystis sp. H4A]MBG0800079.1 DUF2235 domain-containing protein [Methylocystis sp. H4A]
MVKKIVILADGTGNGRLVQVSNINRLSQALCLSNKDQVVYYIPGVGTEGFKPLAMLDGATGLGVPSNVRKLYRFLSWNWEPDAAIYMFGFSRGAFTVRMLIDLIRTQGLLPTEFNRKRVTHQEMVRNSEDAWRAFCEQDKERKKNIWVFLRLPKLRDAIFGVWKQLRGQPSHADVKKAASDRAPEKLSIDFVGLFDTVEAYGVPIEEMRDVIHRFVFPIKFGGDHTMWEEVNLVRQALSLDDERRTFHPIRVSLLEDDLKEPEDDLEKPKPKRIEEVWFAGVHSDVGGGYPDDMTAHCPLVWMIREVENAEADRALNFHPTALAGFRSIATPFGPLHNSRAGAAVLYRYDPRQVTLRDPDNHPYCRPTIHHTVVERLVDGSGDYAPLALGEISADIAARGPKGADVFMPDGSIARAETGAEYALIREADSASGPARLQSDGRELDIAQGAMRSLDAPDRAEMEIARDYVWLNRIAYYFFVVLFLMVITLPLIAPAIDDFNEGVWSQISVIALPFQWLLRVLGPIGDALSRFMSGFENVLRGMGDTILSFTPSYLYAHVKAALNHPFFSLTLVIGYFFLRYKSDSYEDATRYHARLAWNIQNDKLKTDIEPEPSGLSKKVRAVRNSPAARSVLGVGRAMAPAAYAIVFVFAPLLLAANRIGFNYLAGSGRVCVDSEAPEWVASASARFATNDPCWASRWTVERGGVYRLTISIDPKSDDPWLDQLMLTDPYGFDAKGWIQTAGVALRRWPSAAWFHPIARIGARGDSEWPLVPIDGGGALSPRGRRCSMLPLNYSETAEHKSFCANHPAAKSCVDGGLSLSIDPLPADELDAAKAAWARDSYSYDGKSCNSAFPRKTFVSEFVASDTGEFFLFVNDAVHMSLDGRKQIFYDNNTGTAKVMIERLPRDAARATTASAP